MELQTIEKLLTVRLEKWANCEENILHNKQYYFDEILQQVRDEFNISRVDEWYFRFIMRQKYATS